MPRIWPSLLSLIAGLAFAGTAAAHHGWAWTTGENVELTGVVEEARLGNPHGDVLLNVDGTVWTVEVGQPWRNERAGVEPGDISRGVEMRVIGEPSADPDEKRLKVERFYIGDKEYVLYPGRD